MTEDKTKREDLLEIVANLTNQLRQAVTRINDLESVMDSGQLIGRPEAIILLAAKVAHEVNRAYCDSIGDDSQVPWAEAPDWQKQSAIEGVKAISADPSLLPAVSHTLWCRQKKQDGWVYGPKKDAEAKTHPCLVPYSDLPAEQQAKDYLFGAAVRAVLGVSK